MINLVKLKDIAEELKLSVSTVSRVVNNQDRVNPATRKKVQEALQRHHYLPDENARRLKTNTSNVLGIIVPDISNPFYARVIKGIEHGVMERRYSLLLCNTDEDIVQEENAINLLMRQKVAGIIVATSARQQLINALYGKTGCPVVFFDNVPQSSQPVYSVTINNAKATRDLVRYMCEKGHERIYMITGPQGESSADERLAGWRQALTGQGIIPEDTWYRFGDFREASGYRIMTEFLRQAKPPTAVCLANNFMAYGAIKAIEAAGLTVPDDLSIAAFDAADETGLMRLSITTVVQPAEEIGLVSADLCLHAAQQRSSTKCQKVILDHILLHNETVAYPPESR